MSYKVYSLSVFKKNTRQILNEALINPVIIKRYADRFILKAHKQSKDIKLISEDEDVKAQK